MGKRTTSTRNAGTWNADTRVRTAEPDTDSVVDLRDEVQVLRSWGHTAGTAARVHDVRDLDELRQLLTSGYERGLIPRGNGHSLGDTSRCGGGAVVRLKRALTSPPVTGLNWETRRATVRLGSSIASINRELLSQGWFIPMGAKTAQSTFASALSSNAVGPSGTSAGHAHSSVQSLIVMTPAGEVVTWARDLAASDGSGPVQNMTEFSGFVGGQGLLGVGLSAEVAITPVSTSWMVVESVRSNSLAETLELLDKASMTTPYATALLDPSAKGLKVGRGLVRSASHAELADLPEGRQAEALKYGERIPTPPKSVSSRLLDPRLAHRVHRLRYHSWPSTPIVDLQPTAEFFHLDDVTGKYPTLIGPLGMIRYEFSLPQASGPHLASVLEAIHATGSTFGRVSLNQTNGFSPSLLGTNRPALNVTIDIAHPMPSLAETLNVCDEQLAALGGQVVLDSDTRLDSNRVDTMFSGLNQWRELNSKVDPHGRLVSDLSRRIKL